MSGMYSKNRSAGFTMMELLITMAIAAVLMAIGVPSYRYVTNSNRIAGEVNGLLGDLQLARAEAIKEGRTVTVCLAASSTSCATSGANWAGGWVVFSDPTNIGVIDNAELPVLRYQSPFSGTDTFSANNSLKAVTFNREGYAVGIVNGTVITLQDSTLNTAWTRCLIINLTGMMATARSGVTINGVTC